MHMDLRFLTEPVETLRDRASEQLYVLRAQTGRRILDAEAQNHTTSAARSTLFQFSQTRDPQSTVL
jgi:hypothetical protein